MNTSTRPARAAAPTSSRTAPRATLAVIDQLAACFAFPGLSNLATALEERRVRHRGARPQYPDICMLAVLAAARAVGGVQPVVRELGAADNMAWRVCTERLTARVPDLRLPAAPPTRDQVQTFQDRIAREGLIDVLEEAFLDSSVKMAQRLGHLRSSDTAPDWVRPSAAHTIYGDGTVIAPYSKVTSWVHPGTGEVITRGSRARDASSARIQAIRTDTAVDGKGDQQGINFVSMHTWTDAGRVVLATGHALGAESWAATDLLRAVQEHASGGVHTVVYDGVVDGWIVDWLMGALRIQAVNIVKVKKKSDPNTPTSDMPLRAKPALVASVNHAERMLAGAGLDATPELVEYQRVAAIKALYESDEPLPVGLCVYPRTGGTFEIVYSRHHRLEATVHTVDGVHCSHDLVVDDGALYVVEPDIDGEHPVKTQMPRCVSASAARDARGVWNRTTTWRIPCERGDFLHELTWHPTGEFRGPDDQRLKGHPLAELRPLARAHEGFGEVYGRRNDSESYNQWFQASLRHPGVAMSLSLVGQRLDFLMGAVLNNALTWARAAEERPAR